MTSNTTNIDVIRFIKDKLSSNDNKALSTTPFSDRLVYEALRSSRALLLNQKQQANQAINLANYQRIGCVKLKEADVVECPCAPKSGCSFLKTVPEIPIPIGQYYSVTSIDGSINYSYVPWDRFKYKINDRYSSTNNSAYFTTQNTKEGIKIYVYNDIHKEVVSITGIFSDPLKIYSFEDCDGKVDRCFNPLLKPFPIDPELLPQVYESALQLLAPVAPNADKLQNDSEDTYSPTPIK